MLKPSPKVKISRRSLLHLLRMLDYFYLSQTVSDPYSEFLAMHWAAGVTWEAYVLSIIHFAQKHRYFQKLEEHGHQGSAPVNMDADQVFMNHLTNELRRWALNLRAERGARWGLPRADAGPGCVCAAGIRTLPLQARLRLKRPSDARSEVSRGARPSKAQSARAPSEAPMPEHRCARVVFPDTRVWPCALFVCLVSGDLTCVV